MFFPPIPILPESLPALIEGQKAAASAKDLLKPDVFGINQPKDPAVANGQPISLEGGRQPQEDVFIPPVKDRGGTQTTVGLPILGEMPPHWLGGPLGPKPCQFSSGGGPDQPPMTPEEEAKIAVSVKTFVRKDAAGADRTVSGQVLEAGIERYFEEKL